MPVAFGVSLLALVVVAVDGPEALRVPLGLAALFLAPGYALTGALFPRRSRGGPAFAIDAGAGSPMSGAMRFGVAIALSTALLILTAIAVEAVGPLRALRVLGILAAVTGLGTAAWLVRTPKDAKPTPNPSAAAEFPAEAGPESRSMAILLVAAMVLAAVAGAYALLKPRDAPAFTVLYLTASDGLQHCLPDRYVEGAYGLDRGDKGCDDLTPGSLRIGVTNHERRTTDYWLRTLWTREEVSADNHTEVLEVEVIHTWQVTLDAIEPPNDPDPFRYEPQYETAFELPAPPGTGIWRMSVQLYTEEPPPPAPSRAFMESPYKRVHLVIGVP